MNLSNFSTNTLPDVGRHLGPKWLEFLQYEQRLLQDISIVLGRVKDIDDLCPLYNNIFRLFRDCPPDKVRVIIIGQDPYPNENAFGYAFGCARHASPSLMQIIQSVEDSYPDSAIRGNISLSDWVNQGVFLLNTALTTRKGKIGAHSNIGWKPIVETIVKVLTERYYGIPILLWGKEAQAIAKVVNPFRDHSILEATHPQAANYSSSIWNCPNFKEVNNYFTNNLKPLIKW